jgi:hypothetical protein
MENVIRAIATNLGHVLFDAGRFPPHIDDCVQLMRLHPKTLITAVKRIVDFATREQYKKSHRWHSNRDPMENLINSARILKRVWAMTRAKGFRRRRTLIPNGIPGRRRTVFGA